MTTPSAIFRPFAAAMLALIGIVAIDPGATAATRPPKFNYTMTTLPNGLKVVFLEDHSTPIVHAEIWYHVGSKNEKPGRTGFARGIAAEVNGAIAFEEKPELPRGLAPVVDLLRVLLKMKCEAGDVAQRLVASGPDLELIAADDNADVPALHGWRREVFGADALALKHGDLALAVKGKSIDLVPLAQRAAAS